MRQLNQIAIQKTESEEWSHRLGIQLTLRKLTALYGERLLSTAQLCCSLRDERLSPSHLYDCADHVPMDN